MTTGRVTWLGRRMPWTGRVTWSGLVAGLRRHWLIVSLVGVGAAIRTLVMAAYQPAFWFYGDSGQYINIATHLPDLHRYRPLGYSVMLAVLWPTGSLAVVAALQHLAGLAIAVAIYVLLLRRGVPRVVASLAAVPMLLDSLQVDLEHFILSETLFTVLLFAGLLALLWRDQPSPLTLGAAGLLLAGAWFTRPIALAAAVLLVGYLVVRRIGIRALAAFVAAFAVPWAAVLLWVGDRPSTYGPGSTSLFLYGRTAMIADCERLVLPPEQRPLCPVTTPDVPGADRADWYIWVFLDQQTIADESMAPVLQGFAVNVIKQQPGDYAAVVARETAPYFLPWQRFGIGYDVLNQWWTLPASVRDSDGVPVLASPGFAVGPVEVADSPGATSLTRALHWYGTYVRSPALLNSAAVLAAAAAVLLTWFVRRRRNRHGDWREYWPNARDAAALAGLGGSLLVAQVAVSMYEPRQGIAILPLFCVAGALAYSALRGASPRNANQERRLTPSPSSSNDSR